MKTFTPRTYIKKNIRFNNLIWIIFFSVIILPGTNIAHQSEFRMHVGTGSTFFIKTVELYSPSGILQYTGVSFDSARGIPLNGIAPNFVADMTDGQDNTTNPSMSPVAPGSYIIKIDNKWAHLDIPLAPGGGNDFVLTFIAGVFDIISNERGVDLGPTYDWGTVNTYIANSFGGGRVTVDVYNYYDIPETGQLFLWIANSSHQARTYDQQFDGGDGNYMRRFNNSWLKSDFSSAGTDYNISFTIGSSTDTYTANFKNEYNITFQNSFSGATGGVINVSGQQNAPYQTTALQDIGIDATAVTNIINGIYYEFDHWNDASTVASKHFSPTDHATYTAYFTGTPINVNRNLHFYAQPNDPIIVYWNDHPDTNVTQYKIWRKVNYNKQGAGSPQLIGTVNRGTTSFVDEEYSGPSSGFTDWILYYDVKAYYSLEGTYSADDYVQVFSDGPLAKKAGDNLAGINENKIENYPNPFNPSTTISYQLTNAGHVTLKVYDNLGREIKTLVDREQNSGKYSVNFNADNLASGIYYYRIISGGFTATKKMILTK